VRRSWQRAGPLPPSRELDLGFPHSAWRGCLVIKNRHAQMRHAETLFFAVLLQQSSKTGARHKQKPEEHKDTATGQFTWLMHNLLL